MSPTRQFVRSGMFHEIHYPTFDVAAFETSDYLGFVVTPRPNLDREAVAARVAPAVIATLRELDGK